LTLLDLVAFGRPYIANPDLVERIAGGAPLNEGRPQGYYGSLSHRIYGLSIPYFGGAGASSNNELGVTT
jgi:2,4-dienoyl-CoA reductase-like NADH-dependent reductase (Old Yellow Enzyme family)